jgi:hypothetical protein
MSATFIDVEFLETPSKWDIIPIHASDRATFRNCRRAWGWSSPSRENLIPKASVHGIREPLWFGTGIHYALERYYNPRLQEDPIASWQSWFDLQWDGGIVLEKELKEFRDHDPERVPGTDGLFRVRGLRDVLFDADEEHFLSLRELGSGMMQFYKEWAPEHDNFTVVCTEHEFSVPILDPTGNAMYAIDTRTSPSEFEGDFYFENDAPENIFGPLWKIGTPPDMGYDHDYSDVVYKQVHARGRMDMIVQDNDSGKFGIVDFKSAARIDEDYFRHVDLDPQISTYLSLGEIEALMNDFPYKSLDFCHYRAILKAYPKPPTVLKNGMPSIARATESTTAQMFESFIINNGLQEIFDGDAKMQSYLAFLISEGDDRFINSKPVYRTPAERATAVNYLYWEAVDMLDDPKLYPNPRKDYLCLNCVFRAPCIAMNAQQDYRAMLDDGYMPNFDR